MSIKIENIAVKCQTRTLRITQGSLEKKNKNIEIHMFSFRNVSFYNRNKGAKNQKKGLQKEWI